MVTGLHPPGAHTLFGKEKTKIKKWVSIINKLCDELEGD